MKIGIGTFNTRNLANPGVEFYPKEKYTQAEYDDKVAWIQSQLRRMNCAVVGFEEVFHEEALKAALANTNLASAQTFLAKNEDNQPCVAIASNYKILEKSIIPNIPEEIVKSLGSYAGIEKFSRPVLKAKIEVEPGQTITFLVTHLKSKRPEFSNEEEQNDLYSYHLGESRSLIKRCVEAAGLRKIVIDLIKDNHDPLVLLGDLNDTVRVVTSEILAGPNPYKHDDPEKKKKYWDVKLYSAFDIITQKTLANIWYTHIYDGNYEILDHIFVSEEFYFRNENRIWDFDYLKVFNDHLADEKNTKENLARSNSDHGQVMICIEKVNHPQHP